VTTLCAEFSADALLVAPDSCELTTLDGEPSRLAAEHGLELTHSDLRPAGRWCPDEDQRPAVKIGPVR
jgi:hypothetical protein